MPWLFCPPHVGVRLCLWSLFAPTKPISALVSCCWLTISEVPSFSICAVSHGPLTHVVGLFKEEDMSGDGPRVCHFFRCHTERLRLSVQDLFGNRETAKENTAGHCLFLNDSSGSKKLEKWISAEFALFPLQSRGGELRLHSLFTSWGPTRNPRGENASVGP